MKRSTVNTSLVLMIGVIALIATPASAARFGAGLHYLKTVGEMSDAEDLDDFDENDFGFIGSLEFDAAMFRIDTQLEVLPDYAGTDEIMWQPQGYLLLGRTIYAGVGVGIGYLEPFGWQDPFFDLRAGVDIALAGIGLDIYASYRFQTAGDLESLTTDDMNAVTLAAVARFGR